MDFLENFFSRLFARIKSIPWDRDFTYGGPAGGSSNLDGTPMAGVADIQHRPFGITD